MDDMKKNESIISVVAGIITIGIMALVVLHPIEIIVIGIIVAIPVLFIFSILYFINLYGKILKYMFHKRK